MTITLHIDRLILDRLPVDSHDAAVVEAGVRDELTRLLTLHGLAPALAGGVALASVPAQTIPQASRPAALGVQIGRGIHGAIGGSSSRS